MRVLVTGGRDEKSRDYVWRGLDRAHAGRGITAVAHGGASGVDTLAGEWAKRRAIPCVVYAAKWKEYGLKAGPIRNEYMLENFRPDYVIAFAGGKGTAHMVRCAERAGVKVVRVYRESKPPAQHAAEQR